MDYVYFNHVNNFDLVKIEELLIKNQIKYFIKNMYESSVSAGWASPGAAFNEQLLYVEKKKLVLVKKLLTDYI
ncbi:MAG: hypothetical protein CMD27_01365 [Flavobacteriales bacterium]|jgi:hypothetical protein|nr:hypothetical protein [Flavobacteriales bacterium]|tara:strand:- start:1129 stop:1347 length:219 start_codon:yes stop_codon:yes gene_type:complete